MASKKYILDDDLPAEENILLAVRCDLPVYAFCWHLNQLMGWQLERAADLVLPVIPPKQAARPDLFNNDSEETGPKNSVHFIYHFHNSELFTDYLVIENKGSLSALVKGFKTHNFIIQITGPDASQYENICRRLKDMKSIFEIVPAGEYSLTDLFHYAF